VGKLFVVKPLAQYNTAFGGGGFKNGYKPQRCCTTLFWVFELRWKASIIISS
jgi:hypothetical protein